MTKTNLVKRAVAQFDRLDDPGLKRIASELTAQGVHWYIFDETADKEFEIAQLKEHYDYVGILDSKENIISEGI
jgi:hypothetical protein